MYPCPAETRPLKPVLVTGASTGIGRCIVEHLSREGHFVYAGGRKADDLRALGQLENVQPLQLDITNATDVEAAAALIADRGRGLYGLVNNAGIATVGPILNGAEEELALVLGVNVQGTYRVTRAFAPLIVPQRGRVVIIGSISGTLASRNLSAYSMSKHALEAFADSLAAELACSGVAVSIVEPGAFRTHLTLNAAARLGGDSSLPDLSRCAGPHSVAEVVQHALFDPAPKRRYLVVTSEDEARRTMQRQIQRLVEMNDGHAFSLDRHRLIQMLDQALLETRGPATIQRRRATVADNT
jgi:NAD(P)-dependent dehydrogenase (short-subunit alcohol dehydrogenase family)